MRIDEISAGPRWPRDVNRVSEQVFREVLRDARNYGGKHAGGNLEKSGGSPATIVYNKRDKILAIKSSRTSPLTHRQFTSIAQQPPFNLEPGDVEYYFWCTETA